MFLEQYKVVGLNFIFIAHFPNFSRPKGFTKLSDNISYVKYTVNKNKDLNTNYNQHSEI